MLSGREIYENFLLKFSDNERDIMKNLARNIYELIFGLECVVLEVLSTQAAKFKKGGYIEINYRNYPKIFDMDRNLI
jgi:hypothetical protein